MQEPTNQKMNKIKFLLISAIAVALAGCATKTITAGREFDAAEISGIQKGVTTADELKSLLGRPLTTSVQPDGVIWNYYWKDGKATTTQSSDGPVVTSTGEKKTLEVLIKNGVVEDYTYQDEPFWNEQLKGSQ
jgi:outer membrane protein assembly factor BamE (lipoprotein component of BamABCDE complex)